MLSLHDTLSGEVKPVAAADGKRLSLYVCGITPYDACHVGHARTLVAFDIMRRWVEHQGIEVLHIQNVTDIDDKIIKRARENSDKKRPLSTPLALSAHFDEQSRHDMKKLQMLPPTVMPRISEHIPQTIALIEKIIANGSAYVTTSGVYFAISTMPDYGKLSRQDLSKIRAGCRIEVDEKKKNPEDFALWKLDGDGCAHDGAMDGDGTDATVGRVCSKCATSDSRWGRGRPGWHIECSAMSLHYTNGQPLDLHGGARDLIFPHHENEIAQSEASGMKPFARHWVHTGFLTVGGEKMAKSAGNFITIEHALKTWDAQVLRFFYTSAHYRSPIDFSESALEGARLTLENVRRSLAGMEGEGAASGDAGAEEALGQTVSKCVADFARYMNNDLDTPQALSALIAGSKEVARARAENKCSRKVLEMASKQISDGFAVLGIELAAQDQNKKAASAQSLSLSAYISIIPGLDDTLRELVDALRANDEKGVKAAMEKIIEARALSRQEKDWAKADKIRDYLKKIGILLEDSTEGAPKWRYN